MKTNLKPIRHGNVDLLGGVALAHPLNLDVVAAGVFHPDFEKIVGCFAKMFIFARLLNKVR